MSIEQIAARLGALEKNDQRFAQRGGDAVTYASNGRIASLNADYILAGTIDAGVINVTNINADNIDSGTLSANRIGASSITASKLSVSDLSAISANLGTITAGAITGVTITGGTIRTATSGARVQLSGAANRFEIYNASGLAGYLSEYSSNVGVIADAAELILSGSSGVRIFDSSVCTFDITNIDMNDNDITDIDELMGDDGYIDMNSGHSNTETHHLDPSSSDTYNLGGSSRYWSYLNVKEIAKQGGGGFGVFDDGVEMQDGRILTDTEALLEMRAHPTKKTPYGKPIFDLDSIPKVVRITPTSTIKGDPIVRMPDGRLISKSEKKVRKHTANKKLGRSITKVETIQIEEEHTEGEAVFAMMSIMMGAIRELTLRVKSLEGQ